MNALTLNKKRLEYIINKKCYYQVFRVYRGWKKQTKIDKIARISEFNRKIKGVITAYYAIVQNWQDGREERRQCEEYREVRLKVRVIRALRANLE